MEIANYCPAWLYDPQGETGAFLRFPLVNA